MNFCSGYSRFGTNTDKAYGIPRNETKGKARQGKARQGKGNETKRNEMIKKILHKQKGTMALRIIPGLSSKTVLARWRRIGYRRNKALVR